MKPTDEIQGSARALEQAYWEPEIYSEGEVTRHARNIKEQCLRIESLPRPLVLVVEAIGNVEPAQLRRVAAELVGRGGEYTACGRALERLIEHIYPGSPKEPEKTLGFEQAYGDMTLPL